ncbi:heme exporter protein CcmD [Litorilituus lipolyticus]|uniref:Heme exporter protein D n=1 Tax=Litorilituus lipolyticus TaxID=2491017 RepID=A0A502L626_9GAMM|nr:heme exporter protein CcmD [Litorilituus lipolyticus]TPH19362.1 heme exporter protein CcmD [Litorilituus lipolyticus]
MQFNSFSEFINMGGYGFYVWLSFGVSALLLVILLISSKADHQKIINNIAKQKQREDKLRQARELRKQQASSAQDEAEQATS